jgi:hypothetical protein
MKRRINLARCQPHVEEARRQAQRALVLQPGSPLAAPASPRRIAAHTSFAALVISESSGSCWNTAAKPAARSCLVRVRAAKPSSMRSAEHCARCAQSRSTARTRTDPSGLHKAARISASPDDAECRSTMARARWSSESSVAATNPLCRPSYRNAMVNRVSVSFRRTSRSACSVCMSAAGTSPRAARTSSCAMWRSFASTISFAICHSSRAIRRSMEQSLT